MAGWAIIAAVFGSAVGSFLNVVIYRVPRGGSLVRPPSACPSCGTPIAPRDNVPIVSYLSLRARCRHCRAPISIRYPLVEAGTAAVAAASVWRFGATEAAAFVAAAACVLIALTAIDIDHKRVPNVIVLPATAAAAVWVAGVGFATSDLSLIGEAYVCSAAGFVLLFLIALISGGMGMGDVKLALFIGLVTGRFGWEVFVLALFVAFMAGGVVAAALLAVRRAGRKTALPFAPSLAVGTLIAVFAGESPVRAWLGL